MEVGCEDQSGDARRGQSIGIAFKYSQSWQTGPEPLALDPQHLYPQIALFRQVGESREGHLSNVLTQPPERSLKDCFLSLHCPNNLQFSFTNLKEYESYCSIRM